MHNNKKYVFLLHDLKWINSNPWALSIAIAISNINWTIIIITNKKFLLAATKIILTIEKYQTGEKFTILI